MLRCWLLLHAVLFFCHRQPVFFLKSNSLFIWILSLTWWKHYSTHKKTKMCGKRFLTSHQRKTEGLILRWKPDLQTNAKISRCNKFSKKGKILGGENANATHYHPRSDLFLFLHIKMSALSMAIKETFLVK